MTQAQVSGDGLLTHWRVNHPKGKLWAKGRESEDVVTAQFTACQHVLDDN